jgi:xylan 1,4-beta-xylosidase
VRLAPRPGVTEEIFTFTDPSILDDPGWLAVRALPATVASIVDGRLSITGGVGLDDPHPRLVGRRQRHLRSSVSSIVDASAGAGGLAMRYDEEQFVCIEARGTVVTARASVAGLTQRWRAEVPAGDVRLRIETAPVGPGFDPAAMGGDRIRLYAGDTLLTELDGRYWTAESCASFTGRVVGLYASMGTVTFADFRYAGSEA